MQKQHNTDHIKLHRLSDDNYKKSTQKIFFFKVSFNQVESNFKGFPFLDKQYIELSLRENLLR